MMVTGFILFLFPMIFGVEANRTRSCGNNLLDENYGLGECSNVDCQEPQHFGRYRRGAEFRPYRDGQQCSGGEDRECHEPRIRNSFYIFPAHSFLKEKSRACMVRIRRFIPFQCRETCSPNLSSKFLGRPKQVCLGRPRCTHFPHRITIPAVSLSLNAHLYAARERSWQSRSRRRSTCSSGRGTTVR